jgi:hypothetical protein
MTNYKELTIDAITGEQTITDYSPKQIAEAKIWEAEAAERLKNYNLKKAEKETLLAKLGITADEAALLLG